MSAVPNAQPAFPFDTATPIEIHVALLALHAPWVPKWHCGRWNAEGTNIGCCEQCADFTAQWRLAAVRRSALYDVLPRLTTRLGCGG